MLTQKGHPNGVGEWYDRLAPMVEEARAQLRELSPGKLALRSGCERDTDGILRLSLLGRECQLRAPEFVAFWKDNGEELSSFQQALILTYLVAADGTTPSSRWIAFRELPDGMFYAQAFRGYAEDRLVGELGDQGLESLKRGAEAMDGTPLDIGDAGYSFRVLPHVHLAIVYWLGDDEFASRASVLFEDTAPHYMSTDGLAILGSHLVSAVLKRARV
jgi:hypothetical protein